MKKLLLHIILFSYAIVMFKPAFPYLNDAVAHILFYRQHMATVHFENGTYHVHAEVTKNAKEEDSNKTTPSLKKEKNASDHITIVSIKDIITGEMICPKYASALHYDLPAGNSQYNYPPPRI